MHYLTSNFILLLTHVCMTTISKMYYLLFKMNNTVIYKTDLNGTCQPSYYFTLTFLKLPELL